MKNRSLKIISILILISLAITSPDNVSQAQTATPVRHVIIIMMENHSFDNFFGIYPEMSNGSYAQNISVPDNLIASHHINELAPVPVGTFTTKDPTEGYIAYHKDWNNGSMNGFLYNSGPQSMTYYTSAQLAPEWDLAEQYALADMYFASQLTETAPNRLYSLAGFSTVINDYGPPPYIPFNQSIFGELTKFGISWAYYIKQPSMGIGTLNYFTQIGRYSGHIQSWQDFMTELYNGTLPDVAWLMPVDGGAVGYSQGPPSNILKGELWLLYVVNAIESSPEWNSSVVFITYDEGGGYYDHVPPPVVNGTQLGERVPLIIVSPFAKEDYISNTILTHTSLLAFIDYNWKLPALNPLVANSNIPLDAFDFNLSRKPIQFSASQGFPLPNSISFSFNASNQSFARLFPMQLQISLQDLPYGRAGISSITLESLGYAVYTKANSSYVPLYETTFFALTVFFIQLAFIYYYTSKRR
ncbi:MAG: alkaline phosphatase family protein [Conexivisphaerales archaeon]